MKPFGCKYKAQPFGFASPFLHFFQESKIRAGFLLVTGIRMGEQLQMKRHQVDFLRDIVTARNTKNGRPRDIPMNDDVREALFCCLISQSEGFR
jgi:hypothetical protein